MSDDHAIGRARERYGLELTSADLTAISERIRMGDCLRGMSAGYGRREYLLKIGATAVRLVADDFTFRIVTFLPIKSRPHGNKGKLKRAQKHLTYRKQAKARLAWELDDV